MSSNITNEKILKKLKKIEGKLNFIMKYLYETDKDFKICVLVNKGIPIDRLPRNLDYALTKAQIEKKLIKFKDVGLVKKK